MDGHTSTVRCLKALSATTVLSGSRDKTLRVWDIESGQCKMIFEGHTATVRDVATNGGLAVSGSYDEEARIWSLETGKCLRVLKGHESQIYSVVFDGKRIVTGGLDNTARVWDPVTGYMFHGYSEIYG